MSSEISMVAADFRLREWAARIRECRNCPAGIQREEPLFFMQLVFCAVSENEISVQKGAELLKQSYSFVAEQCFAEEDWEREKIWV